MVNIEIYAAMFAQSLVLILIFSATYQIGLKILRIPPRRAERAFNMSVIQKKNWQDALFEGAVTPLIEPVAQLMPLSLETQVRLQSDLRQVGILSTPAEYYAKAFILAVYSLSLSLFVPLLGLNQAYLVAACMAPPLVFRHFTTQHTDRLKEKKAKIERLMPSFIRSILHSIGENKEDEESGGQVNLIKIFTNYLQVAPEIIRYDISLLLTEMKSISVETGLVRFRDRLRMPMVTRLCEILIGISRGQPQAEALGILARDVVVKGEEEMKRELQKRPGKMYRALMPFFILAVVAILYFFGFDLVSSVGYFG